ncbi:MAG: efflux transporter periplasmic adaptor subunit [Phenylobacterium sp.]|nr:efflux transporter periplasmic adaptor subunit [Phenylobacterium sp.]
MRSRSIPPAILAVGAVAALAACSPKPAPPPAPSVLVRTQAAVQGTVPDVVTVYGAAAPATGALATLSLRQPAQVDAILVAPGAVVTAGQRLLSYTLNPASVAAYRQATAALALAQAQVAHANQLFAQQLATRDQVAQAEASLRTAQANLAALSQQGAGVASGAVATPVDGVVVSIPVAVGDQTAAGAPLVTVARRGGLVITAGFEPAAAARLRVGQPATLQSLAAGLPAVQGSVARVSGALNPRTRLIDADIAAPGGSLILGDAYRAMVTVGQVSGWLAPHVGVLNDGQRDYVFQVSGGHARRVDVSLIRSDGNIDVVQGPLDPHLPLVADGAYQLEAGALVRTASAR